MSWSSRRRATFISLFILAIAVALGWLAVLLFYEVPTCLDGEQNGDEEGIDCGGSCERVCSFQAVDPIVRWSRFLEVSPGVYSAVALIENPNPNTVTENATYSFKLRNAENILVYERTGSVAIPAQQQVPIFEPNIVTGERKPTRIFFEFVGDIQWKRDDSAKPELRVRNIHFDTESAAPRLTAELANVSRLPASDVEVVAILLGLDGNAVAASRTVASFVAPDADVPIIFTWPNGFSESIAEVLIIPKVF